jgi:predicted Zn-dependent protease
MARGPASRSAETENNQLHLDGAASRKMRRDMNSLLTLLAACVLLAGCESNPITGRSQLMLVSESMAVSESAAAYSQMMGDLGKKKQIEANSARAQKVRDITDRLVAQAIKLRPDSAAWKWEVQVINDPKTVNAFCMAGGKMAIYTGMWDKLNASDDEIAMVMGHEISHALAGHTQERMSVAMTSQVLAQGVAIAISSSESTRGLALTGAQLAAVYAVQLPNSRTSESEADEIGIQLAARAGYDPKAAVTLWEKMGKLGGTPPEFLSTHPSPEHRAERLKALGEKVQPDYEAVKANPPPHQRLVNLTENARSGAVK